MNRDTAEVLAKVAVLNALYRTNVFWIKQVAAHVVRLDLDDQLAAGSPEAVDSISQFPIGGKVRNLFSFATKYCGWHRPEIYPIYDGFVHDMLVAYRDQDSFTDFRDADLRGGARFISIVRAFQSFYRLEDFSLKDLDRFLWFEGRRLQPQPPNRRLKLRDTAK